MKITRVQIIVTIEEDGIPTDNVLLDKKRANGFAVNDFRFTANRPEADRPSGKRGPTFYELHLREPEPASDKEVTTPPG